jgi:DNA modification methylase
MAKKKQSTGKMLFDSLDAVPSMPEGYYAGDQPNPNLRRFVEEHATPYDPEADGYKARAFAKAITTTKATAIYNMHTYWSKKPHDAIRQYIRHYTKPGDIVLDPMCGSGGTALAALLEGRKAVAIDLSPAATFITKNYCTQVDTTALAEAFETVCRSVKRDIDWLYATRCERCSGPASVAYTVYSQVFQCPKCLNKVPLFDCIDGEGVTGAGKAKKVKLCPHCKAKGREEVIRSQSEKFGAIPVLTSYLCQNGCKPSRSQRLRNDPDPKRRKYFEEYDLAKINEIESTTIPYAYPKGYDMTAFSRYQRDALFYYGVKEVSDLYTKRSLWALAAIRHAIKEIAPATVRDALFFAFQSIVLINSRMCEAQNTQITKGTYYLPQISKEIRPLASMESKVDVISKAQAFLEMSDPTLCISTQSCVALDGIRSNSIDYIFTDPPYSHTVQYGELNFAWEAWMEFDASWHGNEIIVNECRGKSETDWAVLIQQAMSECFRVLKPGRWLSVCYHDTSEGTWERLQDIMAEIGFVVDKSDKVLFIDTTQKSHNQITADKTTKRDLVLNFYKPRPTDLRITLFIPDSEESPTFQEAARQVVKKCLTDHPGSTKDRIYDAVVSAMVRKGQMEAHNFDSLLKSVAEEVQQPVKEDLFRNKEPDLWGSHVQSRWYLKETADQVDSAEQQKEDSAAARLSKFITEYMTRKQEVEGIHYSDLFEQYLPVHDKPRRLLADWLPEYFIKTASGTWRLPDEEESQVLAKLREAGTLRRIKRFANALIDGVPVRDKDRPGSDVDLLDWLRQCRRAGLYEQGRAIFEKGGLNSANLTDEQQIEAEDDYRICVRRGSSEEAKPKRKSPKKQGGDK